MATAIAKETVVILEEDPGGDEATTPESILPSLQGSKTKLSFAQSWGPQLRIPPPPEVTFNLAPNERLDGATTAPVFLQQNERSRGFSFGGGGVRGGAAYQSNVRDSLRRYKYVRQNTVSGDPEVREFPRAFTRALSRTYTLTSTTSSSIPVEEWRPIFDKLDESLGMRREEVQPLAASARS